ncbi:MAG: glycosyltransferase [Anaerolineae bacterium]|nr:glycosyltransferase [Anaerolineae bacterium]
MLDIATPMVLLTGNRTSRNPYKNAALVLEAVRRVNVPLTFVILGERGSDEKISDFVTVRYLPYQNDPTFVARCYQAADIFLHAARADNFPNTILEALACGTPVIATPTGGIPEQIHPLEASDTPTGILVRDSREMARAIERLLLDEPLRLSMGQHAAADARQRFTLEQLVNSYLEWYETLQ